jgi:hypothetical protein
MATFNKFECWEFYGNGDPMFGGYADDRVLYVTEAGLKFLRGCDAYGKAKAVFSTADEAAEAGKAATERKGLISPMGTR